MVFKANSLTFALVTALLLTGFDSTAGTIEGRIEIDKSAQRKRRSSGRSDYSTKRSRDTKTIKVQDVVVYVADPAPDNGEFDGVPALQPSGKPLAIVQRAKAFVPYVLPVQQGATVSFPNEDPFFHNVFSLAKCCKFDLGKYSNQSDAKSLVFDQPGIVEIFCDLHRNMKAFIIVLETPWFTHPDDNGDFNIDDIPPGNWELRAWHPDIGVRSIEVDVVVDGTLKIPAPLILGKK